MARRKNRRDWIVCDSITQTFTCLRCGESIPLGLPMEVRLWVKRSDGFAKMHEDCKEKTSGKENADPKRAPGAKDAGRGPQNA